jgi:hypothetical protein
VRSEAKQRASKENGRKGGLVKSRKKTIAARRNARRPRHGRRKQPWMPRSHWSAHVTARWRLGGVPAAFATVPAIDAMELGTSPPKMPPTGRSAQLGLLCACGRRPIELKGPGCCRLCYYRHYHSLRWFGGLRELVLKRDRFRCRACGTARRLVVHHRDGRNAKPLLVTLCVRCHVRLHHSLRLRRWVPEALLVLWRELHPGAPLQLQLPFVTMAAVSGVRTKGQDRKPEAPPPKLVFGEKADEQPFRCAQPVIRQDDRLGLADRVRDKALGVQPVENLPAEALPGSGPVVQSQKQEREGGFIDFLSIDLHGGYLNRAIKIGVTS